MIQANIFRRRDTGVGRQTARMHAHRIAGAQCQAVEGAAGAQLLRQIRKCRAAVAVQRCAQPAAQQCDSVGLLGGSSVAGDLSITGGGLMMQLLMRQAVQFQKELSHDNMTRYTLG